MAFNKHTTHVGEDSQLNLVEPIRSKEDLRRICWFFDSKGWHKYTVIFRLGINSGLRISDILALKVKDIKGQTNIAIREIKTGKNKNFPIKTSIRKLLDDWIRDENGNYLDDNEWLFKGTKGRHLDRSQVYRRINDAIEALHIKGNFGTHTLRKTFGYHHYKQFKDVAQLQMIFNHTSPSTTLRYIGITQEEINESYEALNLEEDANDLNALSDRIKKLAGNSKKRIRNIVRFCNDYVKGTCEQGEHVPFAKIILEIAYYTPGYVPKNKRDQEDEE